MDKAKRLPFDFGIQRLKRELKSCGMSKKDINKAVKLYKTKVYARVEHVKQTMQKEIDESLNKKGLINATNK